eukprot:g9701.t1
MPPAQWGRCRLSTVVAVVAALSLLASPASAVRPGGDTGVVLSKEGGVVREDGTTIEEYELRESNPRMGHFVSLGLAAQKLLNKSGYAYGSIVRITHSDRDKELFGEGPERTAWFPMVVFLDILEEGAGDDGEDVTSQYEVTLDYKPKTIAAPGVVIMEATKMDAAGSVVAVLDVLPAEEMGFFEKNRAGITMMFGVIIASGIVKFVRRGIEMLLNKAKQSREESEEAEAKPPAEETPRAKGTRSDNPKKKKSGGAKQD